YRQAGNCKEALFFYKRYLALKQNDTKKPLRPEVKAEVEQRIVELEECMRRELASKPPDALETGTTGQTSPTPASGTQPQTTAQVGPTDGQGQDDDEDESPDEPATASPSMVSLRV